MKKSVYKDSQNNFHFGLKSPEGYMKSNLEELKKYLRNIEGKKLWRCNVCGDLQLGPIPIEICPTCSVKDAYVEIDLKEFNKLVSIL